MESQCQRGGLVIQMVGRRDLITPNPKLRLRDQVREELRERLRVEC